MYGDTTSDYTRAQKWSLPQGRREGAGPRYAAQGGPNRVGAFNNSSLNVLKDAPLQLQQTLVVLRHCAVATGSHRHRTWLRMKHCRSRPHTSHTGTHRHTQAPTGTHRHLPPPPPPPPHTNRHTQAPSPSKKNHTHTPSPSTTMEPTTLSPMCAMAERQNALGSRANLTFKDAPDASKTTGCPVCGLRIRDSPTMPL